jgi:small subunit ribosomal protein S6
MNDYEMVVLYHPDLEIDLEKPLKKIEKIVTDNGGKIVKTDNWGKRKLAYAIKKQDHAVYVYYDVQIPSESVAKIEGIFNITDEVIRYLIVKPNPVIEEDEKPKKESSEEKEETTKDE